MPAAKPKTLAAALLAVQAAVPTVTKDSSNPAFRGSKYAGLPSVMERVLPALREQGVLLTQPLTNIDGAPAIRTSFVLADNAEDYLTEVTPLILAKQDSQGVGSAVTYMRRYALLSALGIVADDDDDGNAAAAPVTRAPVESLVDDGNAEASPFAPAVFG